MNMYCHYLFRSNRLIFPYLLLLVSSFASYLTPPFIIGLSIIFFLEKSYKKFLLFISSSIIYLIYYLSLSSMFTSSERRIDESLSIIKFIKILTLQTVSGLDVFFGPTFILKIFSSIYSISLISFLLSLIPLFFFKFYLTSDKPIIYKPLFLGLGLIFLLSCCMFALTGMYTQTAFNLGNRVTIYGSLIIAFLLSIMPFSKKFLILIAIIFILPLFGLSDHWKNWNKNQKILINNIHSNHDFKKINENDILLIKGNTYSKLGLFSHIEFFSMPWLIDSIFYQTVKSNKIISLSKNIYLDKNHLIDKKLKIKINLTKNIFLYDSTNNKVIKINKAKLKSIINSTKPELRHWIQMVDNNYLKSLLFYLSPRLEYLFY